MKTHLFLDHTALLANAVEPACAGVLYISTIDNNVWSPVAYPAGWGVYTEDTDAE